MRMRMSRGFCSLVGLGSNGGLAAEGFYRAMGGQRIGRKPSASIPGRWLPLFRIAVGEEIVNHHSEGSEPCATCFP